MKTYLRIGEIPPDEKSKVHNWGDNSVIREEAGVSVFEYIEGRGIVVPEKTTAVHDFYSLILSDKPKYIVTGDEVGIGADDEPLLKNIKIVKNYNGIKGFKLLTH